MTDTPPLDFEQYVISDPEQRDLIGAWIEGVLGVFGYGSKAADGWVKYPAMPAGLLFSAVNISREFGGYPPFPTAEVFDAFSEWANDDRF